MRVIKEFPINASPSQAKTLAPGEKVPALEVTVDLPALVSIKRIGAKVVPVMRQGMNPRTREIGTYQDHEEQACIYGECEQDAPLFPTKFYIVPNDTEIPGGSYAGSFLLAGMVALHVYGPISSEKE